MIFFSDEILPCDHFNSLISLQNEHVSEVNINHWDDIDSEILEINTSNPCSYHDINSFGNLTGSDKFSLLFYNINSLSKNLDNFYSTILNEPYKPKLLAFCETKLDPNFENLYSIPGYSNIFNSKNSNSGGLALFVEENIKCEIVNHFSYMYEFIESLCVEIILGNETFVVCVIYRRPGSDFDQFMVKYKEILRNFSNKKCIICGDFNLNLLSFDYSNTIESFVNVNFENTFYSLINKPTRVTSHSATVIDHIWCNFVNNSMLTSGILLTDVSDHFAPFVRIFMDHETNEPNVMASYTYRNWDKLENNLFKDKLISELLKYDFDNDDLDIDTSLNALISSITLAIDDICPLKSSKSNNNKHKPKPWITPELKKLIKDKNKLYNKYCKRPITYGDQYRTCRNNLTNLIKISKKAYYQNLLNSCNNDCKKTWNILNNLLNRSPKNTNKWSKMCDGNEITSDVQKITNIFNNYFTNAPINIASTLQSNYNLNYRSYLSGNYSQSFLLRPVTVDGIIKIVKELKNTSSGGHLEIPTKVVKCIVNLIAKPLSIILNKCIIAGYFPDQLKIAQVIPVFKAGDSSKASNFRPISILSIFSKIFERHLYNELLGYLDKHNIICPQQCGFRKGVSTNVAIAKFVNQVITGLNENKYGIGVFLDLQKAFDMVDRDILLGKLQHYGVRGVPLNLLKSFLSNRKQYVKLSNFKSEISQSVLGTPQGGILSPLLFLVFINDIINCSNRIHFSLFADDTCLYMKNSNINSLYIDMNLELNNVSNWIVANSLSLNVNKTVYILFSGRKPVENVPSLILFNSDILRKKDTRFLGLIIDEKLSWKAHALFIKGKISRMLGIVYKLNNCLTSSAIKTIYYSLIYPHLQYGIIFWGAVCKSNFVQIFRSQKKCIRLIANSRQYDHTGPLFKQFRILKLEDSIHQVF